MRVRHMRLCARPMRRPQRGLPSADATRVDRQRDEDVRVANDIMIEEIRGVGPKPIDIDGPATNWNRHPDFILLVAFTLQRQKAESLVYREREQRP